MSTFLQILFITATAITIALVIAPHIKTEGKRKKAVDPQIIERYRKMLKNVDARCNPNPGTDLSHLKWMLSEIENMTDIPKAMRWLGFVQHGIIIAGLTTVEAERNFTRPFFKK